MNTTQETTAKLKFECNCNGCRNYLRRPAQIWHESQISSVTNGHYFTRETMRLFKSRVSDFKPVSISPVADSLAVIVSSIYGIDGAARYYEIVIICPYGEVWREWNIDGADGGPVIKYDSLRAARKSKTWQMQNPAPLCSCHGCQLDRAGR